MGDPRLALASGDQQCDQREYRQHLNRRTDVSRPDSSRRDDGDRRVFALATLAAIAGSPILWTHYLLLLVAPIALIRPKLSWLWLALPATLIVDHLPGGGLTARLDSASPFGQALGVGALVALLSGLVLVLPLNRSSQQ